MGHLRTHSVCILVGSLLCSQLTLGCYQFPSDVKDPCMDKECHFGSKCRPSLDGRTAECLCPEKCANYGDSRGSRPVCGSDGRDYPNVCELERAACKQMREITIKYQGHCVGFPNSDLINQCLVKI
ncbi:hypothetical protein NPIL_186111 [Nephila pilipes]|uniref:Kazal-like domain-containing protein n=1 Tax=Nephila pilipes TaxID=299642 RepID=A0A8X6MNI6_NEPPI|nr:hypothetical protein NPIL_186111 [Nephila pilipes]